MKIIVSTEGMSKRVVSLHQDQEDKGYEKTFSLIGETLVYRRVYLAVDDDFDKTGFTLDDIWGIFTINPDSIWGGVGIGVVQTHPSKKGMGVASALAREVFQYALASNKKVTNRSYEPEGQLYLKHVLHRIADELGVEFEDI